MQDTTAIPPASRGTEIPVRNVVPGIYLYDLVKDMPTNVEYYSDGVHFTAEGNQLRAGLIGEFMLGSGLLPSSEAK